MAGPIELVKKHPLATGVVVVLVIGAVLVFSGGGGATYTETGGGGGGDELAASLAMQQLQAQSATAAMQISAEKEVALAKNATDLTLAQLAKDVAIQKGAWDYQIAEQSLASSERVTTQTNTLTAALKQKELENDAAQTAGLYASLKSQQDTLLKIQQLNASTSLAMQKESNKPKGLFSFIFG